MRHAAADQLRLGKALLAGEFGEPITHEQSMAIVDQVLAFLRSGLDGLRQA